jgi:hypothetical protein
VPQPHQHPILFAPQGSAAEQAIHDLEGAAAMLSAFIQELPDSRYRAMALSSFDSCLMLTHQALMRALPTRVLVAKDITL